MPKKTAPAGSKRPRPVLRPALDYPIRRILVPIDFTDCSLTALRRALSFARKFQAKMVLLYVAETNPVGAKFGARHLPELESDLRRIGRKELAKLKAQEIPSEILAESIIRVGRPDAEILETADRLNIDLIVMATHSHNSQPGQIGSTAERVVRAAVCPVMLVPVQEVCVPFFL